MTKHVTITITVTYDDSTVEEDSGRFAYHLESSVDSAVGMGMLSPSGEEVVKDFEIDVSVD